MNLELLEVKEVKFLPVAELQLPISNPSYQGQLHLHTVPSQTEIAQGRNEIIPPITPKRGCRGFDPATPLWQILLPYTPTKPYYGSSTVRQKKYGDTTERPLRERRPISSASPGRIVGRLYRRYGTPPPRPKFGGLYNSEDSRLQGLDWSQLPDDESECIPTTQGFETPSPNIILEDYDSDDTIEAFAYHAATSPSTIVHYRSTMRRRMKKLRGGACGNALTIHGPMVELAVG
ncbi:hypothetical protein TWF481_002328 [Arthrobotrys musiformis]|uniref:Uncharacterized protein n=1 Tax=Arthrobotrys musiformis TaxID=47236 RepID=A0AAV9VTX9_9PEZI